MDHQHIVVAGDGVDALHKASTFRETSLSECYPAIPLLVAGYFFYMHSLFGSILPSVHVPVKHQMFELWKKYSVITMRFSGMPDFLL